MADSLLPQPRNPARMPEGVENFLAQATVEPLWDVAKGVGALATGQGMVPEVGAGIMGAMGLLSPSSRLAKPVTQGIRAFHGSPHKIAPEPGYPLGRFSMDKIGTGEGAQSYGHGLYFAENEAVAREYRNRLSTPVSQGSDLHQIAANALRNAGGDAKLAEQRLVEAASTAGTSKDRRLYRDAITALSDVPPGHMYEVNINARPEQFLDYDKRLGGQSPGVQEHIRRLAPGVTDAFHPAERVGPDLAAQMREAGIPGIKYLDQGSRTQVDDPATVLKNIERAQTQVDQARRSGDQEWLSRAQNDLMQWSKDYDLVTGKAKGTKNYVVFDDKLIDILKRYGIAGAGLSGLIAANQGDFGYQRKAPLNDTVAAAAYQ